ncbi:putative Hsp20 alpha crystallin family [Trypanosoma vivax]|nr:putative Hsp20 alpha crystallin family [Trypanosoma vivax]
MGSTAHGSWLPAMDLVEHAEGYKLFADVPGMRREDLSVDVEGSRLCIGGDRKMPLAEGEGNRTLVSERGFGRFERCLHLPTAVVENNVKASLKDSVLTVELKKKHNKDSRAGSSVNIQ